MVTFIVQLLAYIRMQKCQEVAITKNTHPSISHTLRYSLYALPKAPNNEPYLCLHSQFKKETKVH